MTADKPLPHIVPEEAITVETWPLGYNPKGYFTSKEDEIEQYFCGEESARDSKRALARQYRVQHENQLLGCFALQADGVRLDGIERPKDIPYLFAPAVKLARFGANRSFYCKVRLTNGSEITIGSYMMGFIVGLCRAMNETVAVRYITLDALNRPKLIAWYESEGFQRTNVSVLDDNGNAAEEVNMLFDLLH
jgi:hypothetical protein